MIISMLTTARLQQRYDHRLRNLVQRTGDVTVATDLGVPRSTARGWLGRTSTVVIGLDVVDLTEPELRREMPQNQHVPVGLLRGLGPHNKASNTVAFDQKQPLRKVEGVFW